MNKKILLVVSLLSVSLMSMFVCSPVLADEVEDLFGFYIRKFTPESAQLIISDMPDSSGQFNDVWLDLKGVMIDKFRMDTLKVRMKGVQFNEPSNWKSGNVECLSAISVQALAEIYERDINKSIEDKTFGDGRDEWHDLSMTIKPSGLKGRGYYNTGGKFLNLDILIEIASGLRIVKGKELWLKDPQVKINKLDLPDYVTKKALSEIQPLVDLREFPLPLSLHKVELRDGSAVLTTRTSPVAPNEGIKYSYSK